MLNKIKARRPSKRKKHSRLERGRYVAGIAAFALTVASVGTFLAPRQAHAATARSVLECYRSKPLLVAGSRNDCVAAVQYYFHYATHQTWTHDPRIDIDGIFGHQTFWATALFQQKNGITVDGKIGNNTWDKIELGCHWNIGMQMICNYRTPYPQYF